MVESSDQRLIERVELLDRLNYHYGRGTLRLASQLYNPEWPMLPQYLSPRYTTRWEDILAVH